MSEPTEFRADLHCHSTCSDGSLSPKEILLLAKKIGLSGISITDHDSVEAYHDLLPFAEEIGISIVSGVEFSCQFRNKSVHVLAYSFALKNPIIEEFCKHHALQRRERNAAILQKLANHGMKISEEEVIAYLPPNTNSYSLGRPHIAIAMQKRGYVQNLQEAFKHYIGEGKPCYAKGNMASVKDTIEIIHNAKGIAVIAHPHLFKNESEIESLLKMPFDGIECYYSKFFPTQSERWIKIAQEKNLLITGGSDFHGDIKPDIPLGCSWIGKDTFQLLLDRFKKNLNES